MADILAGRKPHTIRRCRKRPTKPGDVIKMFIGLRTKHCMEFAKAPCIKVEPVVLWPWHKLITKSITGAAFSKEKVKKIAKDDGFVDVKEFFEFFKRYGKHCLADFEIIWWDPKEVRDVR